MESERGRVKAWPLIVYILSSGGLSVSELRLLQSNYKIVIPYYHLFIMKIEIYVVMDYQNRFREDGCMHACATYKNMHTPQKNIRRQVSASCDGVREWIFLKIISPFQPYKLKFQT